MKLSESIHKLLNEQVKHELQSSYDYLAMALWFETTPYSGFAKWMYKQSEEEKEHADKFIEYINDRGEAVTLMALEQPKIAFTKPIEAFQASMKREQSVSSQILELYGAAQKEGDFATANFLNWFLSEQVEEEASVQDMLDKLELAGDSTPALLRLDSAAMRRE